MARENSSVLVQHPRRQNLARDLAGEVLGMKRREMGLNLLPGSVHEEGAQRPGVEYASKQIDFLGLSYLAIAAAS